MFLLEMKSSSWPVGTYGLIKSPDGCPEPLGSYGWEGGHITIMFKNEVTKESYYTSGGESCEGSGGSSRRFDMQFCSRIVRDTDDPEIKWPNGNYSIHKGTGKECPPGELNNIIPVS